MSSYIDYTRQIITLRQINEQDYCRLRVCFLFVSEITCLNETKKLQHFRYPIVAHIVIGAMLICNVLPD